MYEKITELFEEKKFSEIKLEFAEMNPADAAGLLEEIFGERNDEKELIILFRLHRVRCFLEELMQMHCINRNVSSELLVI